MISANLGKPTAKSNVGLCYIEGDGVEKDEKEAIRWFVDAANNGDVLGQYCLGCCFLYGTEFRLPYNLRGHTATRHHFL